MSLVCPFRTLFVIFLNFQNSITKNYMMIINTRWKTSYWGDCTKTCNGGVKKRNVRCIQRSGNGVEYSVDPSLCTGRMPADTEGCNKEPCPSEWIAQPFGEVGT